MVIGTLISAILTLTMRFPERDEKSQCRPRVKKAVPRCYVRSARVWLNKCSLFMPISKFAPSNVGNSLLVGGFKHFIFFHHIYGIILPIDLYFSRWLVNHQPVNVQQPEISWSKIPRVPHEFLWPCLGPPRKCCVIRGRIVSLLCKYKCIPMQMRG